MLCYIHLSARITTRQQQRRAGDMFVLCGAFIQELGRGGGLRGRGKEDKLQGSRIETK
jgi:hypothetical protein